MTIQVSSIQPTEAKLREDLKSVKTEKEREAIVLQLNELDYAKRYVEELSRK